MKLTKNEIGQKFRIKTWAEDKYFLLLAISSKGTGIGEDEDGMIKFDNFGADDWLPYEELQPKQEVLMSPKIMTSGSGHYLHVLQSDKPLRVVLKNCKAITNYSEGRLVDRADIEADLWIKIKEE